MNLIYTSTCNELIAYVLDNFDSQQGFIAPPSPLLLEISLHLDKPVCAPPPCKSF